MKRIKLKKRLAVLIALCFTLTACSQASKAPAETSSNADDTTSTVATGDKVKIGDTGYATLEDAVKAAADGDTVTLLTDIALTAPLYIGSDIGFTLDLNGKALDGGSNMAIQHDGTGILNITDSSGGGVSIGQVKSAGGEDVATIGIGNSGHLVLSGSAMITTDSGIAILNLGSGSVFIADGDANATSGGTAIKNGEGEVIVAGGSVGTTGGGYGIWNEEKGSVNVSGGSVYAEGRYCAAIYNFGTGSVNVSGGTISCDGSDSHAILNNATGTITIAGGTIRNNYDMGTAICNEYGGTVSILDGTLPIPDNSESPVIVGGGMAIDAAPILGADVQVTSSADISGTPTVGYDAKKISEYKYLKFEQGSTSAPTSGSTKEKTETVAATSNPANSTTNSNPTTPTTTSNPTNPTNPINPTTTGAPVASEAVTLDKKDTKVYEITPESSGPYDPGYTVRFVIVTGDGVTKVEYGHFLQDGVVTLTTPTQTKHNLNYWYVDIVMPGVGAEQRTVTFYAKGYEGSKELDTVFTDVLINAGELDG